MMKTVARNKWRLFAWVQAGVLAVVLVGFGTIAIAQNASDTTQKVSQKDGVVPGMLISGTPNVSSSTTTTPTEAPSESPAENGPLQMDARSNRLQEEFAQCMAAMEQINQRIRELTEVTNFYNQQLNNFVPTPYDPNLPQDETNAIWAADSARRQAIQAQMDAANAAEHAYEATTPMADGGMSCGTGSGPYPQ